MIHQPSRRGRSLYRRALRSLPAMAAAALVVAVVAAPLNADAAPTWRGSGVSAAGVQKFVSGARSLFSQRAHAQEPALSQPHQTITPCTFNGQTDSVPNVTAGGTIAVSCTGFAANEQVLVVEASPLLLAVDDAQALKEFDTAAAVITNASAGGVLTTTFTVPHPFSAGDPAASCPPSQIQENSGLETCAVIVADAAGNGNLASLDYTGQAVPEAPGYWEGASDGGIFSFNVPFQGSEGGKPLDKPIVGMAYDPVTGGYWEVASDGGIFAFGAPFDGSMGGQPLVAPIVGMAYDPNSGGYWEVASDGGIFSFGGAPFAGSEGGKPLDKPIVGMAADPLSGGYWEVASDGGIFSFGGASFEGSEGGKPLDKPIVGMAYDPNSGGYWEVASDGGIFSFGGAPFAGSEGGKALDKPIVGMATDPLTGGYWEVASDGGLFSFNAPFEGSEGGKPLTKPIVGMAPALFG